MRDRIADARVVGGDHGLAGAQRLSGDAARGRELEADQLARESVDGLAPQDLAVGIEDEAVRRVRLEQGGDLRDQALEDGVQLQVAGEHPGGVEERALPREPLPVLAQETGDVDSYGNLAGDGLGERDLVVRPRPRLAAMEREDADQLVEDDDRRREDGTAAEPTHRVTAPERPVVELRRSVDVVDRDRPPLAGGEVRDQEGRRLDDRLQARRGPLRGELLVVREPDETPVDRERPPGLLDRDAQETLGVELRAHLRGDARHQPLARERVAQSRGHGRDRLGLGGLIRRRLGLPAATSREQQAGRADHGAGGRRDRKIDGGHSDQGHVDGVTCLCHWAS